MSTASASPVRAYLELFRLPNVFTAVADIVLGFGLTHSDLQDWPVLAALVASSALIYTAGMVLNDVFDLEVDRAERPHRPLPSGRVSPGAAQWLGVQLMVLGMACGWLASYLDGRPNGELGISFRSGMTAVLLAGLAYAYDRGLKRTVVGPLAMGGCRTLNVLLGMSAAAGPWHALHFAVAVGVGVYVAGITWFSRSEAGESRRWWLLGATLVMLAGLGIVAGYPQLETHTLLATSSARFARELGLRWYALWFLLALVTARRCLYAILDPSPGLVQAAVKQAILSLIVIDAAACYGVRGLGWAVAILALLAPSLLLGRWLYST